MTLAERIGSPAGLRLGGALGVIALLWTGLVATAWWQVALGAVLGMSGSMIALVAGNLYLLVHVPVSRRARGLGALQALLPLTGVVAGLGGPILSSAVGWRAGFVVVGLATVPVLCWLRPRATPIAPAPLRTTAPAPRRRPLRPSPRVLLVTCAVLAASGASNALVFFTASATEAQGFGDATVGAVLIVGSGLVIAVRLRLGWLIDRRGGNGVREFVALTGSGAVALAALALVGDGPAFVVVIVVSWATAWGWSSVVSLMAIWSAPEAVGAAIGTALGVLSLGNVVGPLAAGLIVDTASYDALWAGCAVLLGLGAVSALAARAAPASRAAGATVGSVA